MSRPKGSIIGARPTWTTTATSGIWTLRQAEEMKAANQWPRGPVAPTSLAGTGGDQQVALTWVAPATTHGTITDYVVEYTPAAGSPTVVATGSTAASYTLTGLTNGTEYTIRVAGVNYTRGDWSGSVAVTPSAVVGFAGPAPLAYWRLSDLTDSSGNAYTLTNNNSVTFTGGKIGNAASFSGSNYLSTSETLPPWSGTTAASISAWVYRTASANAALVGDFYRTPLALYSTSSGTLRVELSGGSSLDTPSSVSNSEWHHLAATWNNSTTTLRLYLDGAEVAENTSASYSAFGASGGTGIGAYGDGFAGTFFTGLIDEVGIWDEELSAADIEWLYNSGTGQDPTA